MFFADLFERGLLLETDGLRFWAAGAKWAALRRVQRRWRLAM
jgi:hypothetical protein